MARFLSIVFLLAACGCVSMKDLMREFGRGIGESAAEKIMERIEPKIDLLLRGLMPMTMRDVYQAGGVKRVGPYTDNQPDTGDGAATDRNGVPAPVAPWGELLLTGGAILGGGYGLIRSSQRFVRLLAAVKAVYAKK